MVLHWRPPNVHIFHTDPSLVIAALKFSLLSKSVVIGKLLPLQKFVQICYSATFGSAIT